MSDKYRYLKILKKLFWKTRDISNAEKPENCIDCRFNQSKKRGLPEWFDFFCLKKNKFVTSEDIERGFPKWCPFGWGSDTSPPVYAGEEGS